MSDNIKLKVQRSDPDALLPTFGTDGSACFDLYAHRVGGIAHADAEVLMQHGHYDECVSRVESCQSVTFGTGLSFEIPDGYAMLVFSRSGHGFKNAVRLANCVGVIDSDYRGEVKVALTNDRADGRAFSVKSGDRIAQALVLPITKVNFVEVEELAKTGRAASGLGSTGA